MGFRNIVNSQPDATVTCIACGTTVERTQAYEYDKYGDRFDREEKRFEMICKPCHDEYCQFPRVGLEETLAAAGAGRTDDATFLERYFELATED